LFVKEIRDLIYALKFSITNQEDGKQVVRSSGSVAANYMEANEHLSDKDFDFRIKICRKEAKETMLWLNLLKTDFNKLHVELLEALYKEAEELKNIFSSIVEKRKHKSDLLFVICYL